jgi:hypothetical protein
MVPTKYTTMDFIRVMGRSITLASSLAERITDEELSPEGRAYLHNVALTMGDLYVRALATAALSATYFSAHHKEPVAPPTTKELMDIDKEWNKL